MIQILTLSVIFLYITAALGALICHVIKFHFDNPIKTIFIGMFCLGFLLRLCHFFVPLNFTVMLMFLLMSTSYHVVTGHLFLRNLIQKMKGIVSIYYLIPITLLLFLANFTSISYDEGLYHANFIRWVNSYPCIRGIANLHGRLGFNGTWHVMAAAFNGFPFFRIDIFINPVNDFVWDSIPAFYPLRGGKKDPRHICLMGDHIEDGFYTKPESY